MQDATKKALHLMLVNNNVIFKKITIVCYKKKINWIQEIYTFEKNQQIFKNSTQKKLMHAFLYILYYICSNKKNKRNQNIKNKTWKLKTIVKIFNFKLFALENPVSFSVCVCLYLCFVFVPKKSFCVYVCFFWKFLFLSQ